MEVTKEDFDNAVKQRWHWDTCLIAQTMMRHNIVMSTILMEEFMRRHPEAYNLRSLFDNFFLCPGDENIITPLKKLRDSLPVRI